jgi:murein DD-endopeptidase MepM/ murein hydrolase activator NlpD
LTSRSTLGVLASAVNSDARNTDGPNEGKATLTLTGLTAGATYYVVADGATTDVFGMGAYKLSAQFGQSSTPQQPTVSIGNTSATEGDSGTTQFNFTVSLSAASSSTVTVQYATANGTASSSSDYTATSGTISFAPGETSKTVSVLVNGDTTVESDETFKVTLSSPTNATLGTASGTFATVASSTPIYTASDGVVAGAAPNAGYGNWIRIDHSGTLSTNYGHLSEFAPGIKEGVQVDRNELIDFVGNTGRSTGSHLHFEILSNGKAVDPLAYSEIKRDQLRGADLERFRNQVERARAERDRETNTSLVFATPMVDPHEASRKN